MNKLYVFFLIMISNNFLFSMEAKPNSLAFVFGIDKIVKIPNVSEHITKYSISNIKNQWWYVDKDFKHQGQVRMAHFNKAGTEVLTAEHINDTHGAFCLWDSNTGMEIEKINLDSLIQIAVFNKSEDKIFVAKKTQDTEILIYEKSRITSKPEALAWGGFFTGFKKNNTEMIMPWPLGITQLWDVRTQEKTFFANYNNGSRPTAADWNTDETKLVTMAEDGLLQIWDTNEIYQELLRYKYAFEGRSAHFNQQGTELLAYGLFPTAYIQDSKSGEILMELLHPVNVSFAHFNNEGNEIYTVADDNIIRIWDRNSGKVVAQIFNEGKIQSLQWNGTGTQIVGATADCARIWARYEKYTLPQILLKNLLVIWWRLKKPSKTINSSKKLLDKIAKLLHGDRAELEAVWVSFSKNMQEAIWASMYDKIQKYGKELKNK